MKLPSGRTIVIGIVLGLAAIWIANKVPAIGNIVEG